MLRRRVGMLDCNQTKMFSQPASHCWEIKIDQYPPHPEPSLTGRRWPGLTLTRGSPSRPLAPALGGPQINLGSPARCGISMEIWPPLAQTLQTGEWPEWSWWDSGPAFTENTPSSGGPGGVSTQSPVITTPPA